MVDFDFVYDGGSRRWVIYAPRRSRRPDVAKIAQAVCPFCIGSEHAEREVYRVGGEKGDSNWKIRSILNKFPFAPVHELVVHSPDHHKNFDELPLSQIELIFRTYRERYNFLASAGQVYIFHNRGIGAGESLPHPHTQVVVVPSYVDLMIPAINRKIYRSSSGGSFWRQEDAVEVQTLRTKHFLIFCPLPSQWPDEVWIAPLREKSFFGEITDEEIGDISFLLLRLLQIFDIRYGHEFPFNFYIYPGKFWYLRIIPRVKTLGGFEIGTNIFVNTQDPKETFAFIAEHFWEPKVEKILHEHQVDYLKGV